MALPNGAGGYQLGDGNLNEINMTTQVTPTAKVAAATAINNLNRFTGVIQLEGGPLDHKYYEAY